MDLCRVKPEKLIKFSKKITIEFLGANSSNNITERHYLVNGIETTIVAGIELKTMEEDFEMIRNLYKKFR